MKSISQSAFAVLALLIVSPWAAGDEPPAKPANTAADGAAKVEGKFASVNGLKMYYEIHGTGQPLVQLHGAFGWATVFPTLARNRQVIAVELQGHGRTGDIDRPLSVEQMADDTAELLKQLKIEQADFFGYSMGGNVALAVAVRHPRLVRKLVITGSHSGKMEETYEPEVYKQFLSLGPDFAPEVLKGPYDKMAPDPKKWPVLVAKVKQMGIESKGITRDQLQSIRAHTLIALGDRDGVRPEHAVEMFRQIPNAQLAVFPGGDHFLLFQRPEAILPTFAAFLDAPLPETSGPGK